VTSILAQSNLLTNAPKLSKCNQPIARLFFNIGVEIGQILFIVAVFVIWALLNRILVRLPARVTGYAPAYAIGIVAAFWTIERIAGF